MSDQASAVSDKAARKRQMYRKKYDTNFAKAMSVYCVLGLTALTIVIISSFISNLPCYAICASISIMLILIGLYRLALVRYKTNRHFGIPGDLELHRLEDSEVAVLVMTEEERQTAALLRSADIPNIRVLRPAHPQANTPPEQLLRPTTSPDITSPDS